MRFPLNAWAIAILIVHVIAYASAGQGHKKANSEFSKSNPTGDNHSNSRLKFHPLGALDDIMPYAFELANGDKICAEQACLAEHPGAPAACTPEKRKNYEPRCAKLASNLGIKKPNTRLDPKKKAELQKQLEAIRKKYRDDLGFQSFVMETAGGMQDKVKGEKGEAVEELIPDEL